MRVLYASSEAYPLLKTGGLADVSHSLPNALSALGHRSACLLANHGVIALGPGLAKALWLANEVEILAKQYFVASHFGEPVILPDDEMEKIIKAFKSYGPKKAQEEQ